MKLTVVRHGETVENVNQIVQGHSHGTLTERGYRQAKELAGKLKGLHFDQIYSSDLRRCTDTAKYILEYHSHTPYIKTKNLREIGYGSFQGKPASEIDWDKVEGDFLNRRPGEGESVIQAGQRLINFTNEVFERNHSRDILFITHGGPMRILKAAAEHYDIDELEKLFHQEIENCAIWNFETRRPLGLEYLTS